MSNLTTLLNVNVHNPRICYCVDFLQPLDPYLILLHLQLFGYFPPENTQISKNTPKNIKYACFFFNMGYFTPDRNDLHGMRIRALGTNIRYPWTSHPLSLSLQANALGWTVLEYSLV